MLSLNFRFCSTEYETVFESRRWNYRKESRSHLEKKISYPTYPQWHAPQCTWPWPRRSPRCQRTRTSSRCCQKSTNPFCGWLWERTGNIRKEDGCKIKGKYKLCVYFEEWLFWIPNLSIIVGQKFSDLGCRAVLKALILNQDKASDLVSFLILKGIKQVQCLKSSPFFHRSWSNLVIARRKTLHPIFP